MIFVFYNSRFGAIQFEISKDGFALYKKMSKKTKNLKIHQSQVKPISTYWYSHAGPFRSELKVSKA